MAERAFHALPPTAGKSGQIVLPSLMNWMATGSGYQSLRPGYPMDQQFRDGGI